VILAFCWAHGRRRFYEIAKAGSAPIAEEALRRIAALYAIEAQIRGRSAEESRAARQAKSNPWSRISRGGWKLGSRHREGLKRFLEDGRIEIVTNIVERSMQPIALSRENALFAGHDNGGDRLACLFVAINR
jgi:transposase